MMITNQMLPNGNTRCWDRKGMYEIPTIPEAVRPQMTDHQWKPGNEFFDSRRETVGVTAGKREGI
jgi:hypothetical protein